MNNEELRKLMEKKKAAQAELMESFAPLEGKNPMSLMMNPSALGDVFDSFKNVAAVNDRLITELAYRSLSHGNI